MYTPNSMFGKNDVHGHTSMCSRSYFVNGMWTPPVSVNWNVNVNKVHIFEEFEWFLGSFKLN